MAIVKEASRYQMKIEYKTEYDTTGQLDLAAWTQTLSYVDEEATNQQLYDFVDGIASLTVYKDAPYKRLLVDTSELVVS